MSPSVRKLLLFALVLGCAGCQSVAPAPEPRDTATDHQQFAHSLGIIDPLTHHPTRWRRANRSRLARDDGPIQRVVHRVGASGAGGMTETSPLQLLAPTDTPQPEPWEGLRVSNSANLPVEIKIRW